MFTLCDLSEIKFCILYIATTTFIVVDADAVVDATDATDAVDTVVDVFVRFIISIVVLLGSDVALP